MNVKYATTMDGSAEMSQTDVGKIMGISRERVYQIEQRAFEKMRKAMREFAAADGVSVREWLFG